jgi:hypothetical protein
MVDTKQDKARSAESFRQLAGFFKETRTFYKTKLVLQAKFSSDIKAVQIKQVDTRQHKIINV